MKKYTHNGKEITPQNGYVIHPISGIAYPTSWTEMDDIVIEDIVLPEPPAPEPQPRTWMPLAFLELFTSSQQLAVKQASMQNAQVGLWYDKMLAASQVVENDERLLEGLAYLVQAGVLTQTEIDEAMK